MRKEMHPFDLCVLEGTWRQMGEQYGADCAEDILFMRDWWYGLVKYTRNDVTLESAVDSCRERFGQIVANCTPHAREFMEGIATGSGLSYEEILFINSADVFMGGLTDVADIPRLGCTALAIAKDRTADGKTIIAQNMDWHTDARYIILQFNPVKGPRFLGATFTGCCAQMGQSDAGFGFTLNALVADAEPHNGIPMYCLCQEALSQENIVEAMNVVTTSNRSMAFNYLFAHESGLMVDLETTIENFGFLLPEDGFIVHTNHFVTPWLQPKDVTKLFTDTLLRYQRAQNLIRERLGEHTKETVQEILRDHEPDRSCSICLHAPEGVPYYEAYISNASLINIPADKAIYITEQPCENRYTKYSL